MTTTNMLLRLQDSELSGSDLIRLYAQKYGGDQALSLAVLTEYLNDALTFGDTLTTQYEAPTATGFSVTVSAANSWLVLTPVAGYATGTIVLPTGTQGLEVLVNCTQAVTALTVTPATGESVVGAPTGLAANDFFRLRFDSVLSRWYRVG